MAPFVSSTMAPALTAPFVSGGMMLKPVSEPTVSKSRPANDVERAGDGGGERVNVCCWLQDTASNPRTVNVVGTVPFWKVAVPSWDGVSATRPPFPVCGCPLTRITPAPGPDVTR